MTEIYQGPGYESETVETLRKHVFVSAKFVLLCVPLGYIPLALKTEFENPIYPRVRTWPFIGKRVSLSHGLRAAPYGV
jgi:hypothetical protein